MKSFRKLDLVCALVAYSLIALLPACGGGGGSSEPPPKAKVTITINGVAQKGPLVKNSTVTAQELNSALSPTGKQYSYQITDDLGRFAPDATQFSSLFIGLNANGYYYDEVLNAVSTGPLALQGVADLNTDTVMNVNLLSTLAYNRIKTLVDAGMTIAAARTQAEAEVLKAFYIYNGNAFGSFGSLDIAQHRAGDNILAAISSLFVNGNNVGNLSLLIANFQSDLADNGIIDTVSTTAALTASAKTLNPATIAANLTAKYAGVTTAYAATDISDWIDQDGDGVIGRYKAQVTDAGPASTYTLPSAVVDYLAGQTLTLSAGQITINGTPATGAFTLASGDTVAVTPAAAPFPAGVFTIYLKSGTTNLARVRFIIGLLSIAVTPANPSVPKGLTIQLTATGTFTDSSTADLTSSASWSSATTAATINATGLASGSAVDTSLITATSGAINGSTTLTVTPAVLQSIAVTPANASLAVQETRQYTATGTYSDNNTLDITGSVIWSPSTTAATINAAGLATAMGIGSTTIVAASGAITGSTGLSVVPAWTWVSGSDTAGATGVYGTKGVAAASNVPGARTGGVSWTDAAGNLWLFGGYSGSAGGPGRLNDLWKWDGAQWTWVSGGNTVNAAGVYGTKGIAAASNVPGARIDGVSWKDAAGNLWLFGGGGFDSAGTLGRLNDLWKWDGAQWTWVSGSNTVNAAGVYGTKGIAAASNVPGARYGGGVSWAAGNLWLFGGHGYDSAGTVGYLNDLWKWDGAQWTWVSGSDTVNAAGVYGTKGIAAASNVPGARWSNFSWKDATGNLWLFGGDGYGSAGPNGNLNDLWKWDGAQWTWVSGSSGIYTLGVYGTQGVAAASNVPGARNAGVSWTDAAGNQWLLGGFGYGSAGAGYLNDLWKWDGAQWTWVSGSDTANVAGVYGTKGVAAAANVPGARSDGVSWTDAAGNLWLFGGYGGGSQLNDLWKFGP